MDHSGVLYSGERAKDGRLEGHGEFTFASGNTYDGELLDGRFHGKGVLHFPDGGRYIAEWRHGTVLSGQYVFADKLFYQEDDWDYCVEAKDRRFHEERCALQPTGSTLLTNHPRDDPDFHVPPGCYDVGNGYYDPHQKCIYEFKTKNKLRDVPPAEEEWIVKHCRQEK